VRKRTTAACDVCTHYQCEHVSELASAAALLLSTTVHNLISSAVKHYCYYDTNLLQVDSNTAPFEWQLPDLTAIRTLCSEVIGWSRQQTDGLILPMMTKLQERSLQPRLDSYFTAYHANAR
jgi:hypothetical protein